MNCNLDTPQIPAYDSRVVFGNRLPVLFKIESNLFPINKVPYTTFTSTSQTASNGYAKITLTASNTGYKCGDYVKVTGSYEGVYKIIDLTNGGLFVIDVPFVSTGTAPFSLTVQRYYNNYYVEANVYAGIPDSHFYNADNPMRYITTLRVTPNLDNVATIDVSGAIRSSFLPIENEVCGQLENALLYLNDRRAWVAFYIEYREVYDFGSDCEIEQYIGDWQESGDYYAINGTTQFQYKYGYNAGEYVLNYNSGVLPAKYLTPISTPIMWRGKEFDMAIFIPKELTGTGNNIELVVYNAVDSQTLNIDCFTYGEGVYRFLLSDIVDNFLDSIDFNFRIEVNGLTASEIKLVKINSDCSIYEGKHVSYLNTLGGWDYLFFGAGQDVNYDVEDTQEVVRNIFEEWDAIFVGGTTQLDNVRRQSRKTGTLRTTPINYLIFREYMAQLGATVKMQEIIELDSNISCLEVANRKTLIPTKTSFAYTEVGKENVITLDYKETNEIFSQWQ
jgi:hypothetical protein